MGNEITKRLSPAVVGAAILCGKILLGIVVVAILGFLYIKL